jgi:hypothetical protein
MSLSWNHGIADLWEEIIQLFFFNFLDYEFMAVFTIFISIQWTKEIVTNHDHTAGWVISMGTNSWIHCRKPETEQYTPQNPSCPSIFPTCLSWQVIRMLTANTIAQYRPICILHTRNHMCALFVFRCAIRCSVCRFHLGC